MKTPEKIKYFLQVCGVENACDSECPHFGNDARCESFLMEDALAYIEQLEKIIKANEPVRGQFS